MLNLTSVVLLDRLFCVGVKLLGKKKKKMLQHKAFKRGPVPGKEQGER